MYKIDGNRLKLAKKLCKNATNRLKIHANCLKFHANYLKIHAKRRKILSKSPKNCNKSCNFFVKLLANKNGLPNWCLHVFSTLI